MVSSGRHRHTIPAAFANHQRHAFDGEFFCREDQVGFVFAIVVVEQGDGAAFAQGLQGSGNTRRDFDKAELGQVGRGRGGKAGETTLDMSETLSQ